MTSRATTSASQERSAGSAGRLAAPENRLLAALPGRARRALQPQLERVHLATKQTLYEPGEPVEYVYFPITSVVSLFAVMAAGDTHEVTTVGDEGLVGSPVVLGESTVHGRAVGQIEGEAWRVPARAFSEQIRQEGPLRTLVQRYIQVYVDHLSQSAACSVAHSLEARCARALLLTHDRVEGDHFQLTQEAVASMLGVRRATASGLMGRLQGAGIVRYSRGRVSVLDHDRLAAAACECYGVVKDEYDLLLGTDHPSH